MKHLINPMHGMRHIDVTYICPICFEKILRYSDDIPTLNICKNDLEFNIITNTYLDGCCNHCKNYIEEFIEIDTDIVDAIIKLNKKGYKTKFCCAGHKHINPYIYFDTTIAKHYNFMFDNLPISWYLDIRDMIGYKYDAFIKPPSYIIRSCEFDTYRFDELNWWIEQLPNIRIKRI